MKRIRILAVGRMKTPHWLAASAHYEKRLSHGLRLEESIVRDAAASLPLEARREQEGERLLKLVRPSDYLICLDETGESLGSEVFAERLRRLRDAGKIPCFVVGGAWGLSEKVRAEAAFCLSFGPMTFPHELARVLLLEQLYRAEQILAGTGYHH